MAKHQACHGCLDGCTRESAVHCTICVNQAWPCEAQKLTEEIERYRQRSRDEDTVRIRLNHARIEAREAVALLNSMIESGESHSKESRAAVRKVLEGDGS